jgi:hypothetical protein
MTALRIAGVTGVFLACIALPFLPGRYDPMAIPVSRAAQLFAFIGLILVPAGILWLVRPRFAMVGRIAATVVWVLLAAAAATESISLGIALLVLSIGVWKVVKPLDLIAVPIAVALFQFAIGETLTTFSRNRAIRNSAALIADIERYRVANGRYPRSTVSVNKDYWPAVIGIGEYRYEPHGEAYNVLFENPNFRLGTREIVMYNPRGEHAMTSHAMDVLQLTPEQLRVDQSRGHNELHDAPRKHWKYYWFD